MKPQDNEQFRTYPHVLFRVKDGLFSISSEYITDMLPVSDKISKTHQEQGAVRGMFQSFGRLISILDMRMLLGFCDTPTNITGKFVLVLRQKPYKGLIVDEIISVLSPADIVPIKDGSLRCDFVTKACESTQVPDIFLEISIDRLLKHYMEKYQGQ